MWVASKALGVSPFSDTFSSLSEAQVMWSIANYYKDQEEDLEKFKLICRFINPKAAAEIWDEKAQLDTVLDENSDEIWRDILAHSKSGISPSELRKRVSNPEEYAEPEENLDKIEVIK